MTTTPDSVHLAGMANLIVAMERSFAEHADQPALQHRDKTVTYGALGARARRVAAGIKARLADGPQGNAPVVVALVLDPSAEFIEIVVGALIAGAAYLPVDAQAPDQYIEGLLTEARPQLVVTDRRRVAALARAGHPVVVVDDLAVDPADEAATVAATAGAALAAASTSADDAAYVIFTSGSTGRPKGVVVSHGALLNSTAARLDAYGVPARMPLVHSVAFDLASGVIFWALLTGGTLIISPVELRDVAGTLALVRTNNVTHLVYPASLYGPFLDRAAAHDPPAGLEAVMIGSERWSPALIDRHRQVLPKASLFNEYGPTEACVWSSYACVYDGATGHSEPLTIGQPLAGVGYRVLDPDGRRVPAGAEGELHITGRNLAAGYLGRRDLTATRFVALETGERAYRSGDLVRQTPTGDYELIGRVDRQLKVGGNRVEPGHVENVLMGHPDVVQAYVTTRDDMGPGATLVAYLVTRVPVAPAKRPGGGQVTIPQLRTLVDDALPAYMVPSAFVVVDELPRTRNGKIDESQLPAPTPAGIRSRRGGPADPVEADVARMLGEILGTSAIALDASLVDNGASSLSIVSLAAGIAQHRGVEVPISAMFAAPTIRDLADRIRTAPTTDRPALVATGRQASTAPLSPQQSQIWFLHHLDPDSGAYNTQFSLRLFGPLDVAALQGALSQLVTRHEILRTTFHDTPDGPAQVVRDPWPVALEVDDLTEMPEAERDAEMKRRAAATMATRFDISALPLVTWRLFRLDDQTWRLLQVEHHLAHDGWSASLLLRELRDTYRALATGRPPVLAELGMQYRDYARWYEQWRHSGDYAAQARWWLDQLDGCSPAGVTFEADHPRPSRQRFRGGCVRATIPAATLARLDEICERHQVTRFAACLAAFALQTWRHTGETDMVIGSALSNRRLPGAADMVGMLVNALPLRLRLDPDVTVGANVASVMATITGAQDHQEFPLVDLIAKLGLARDPARNPLFSLMFAFHDSPRPRFEVDGLTGELWIEHNGSAKNDINVVCVPNPPQQGAALAHDGLSVLWEYNEDLFYAETAQRLLDGFLHIVETLPGSWDKPLHDVDLLATAETDQILHAGHGPDAAAPFITLQQGVDIHIQREPDAPAIVAGDAVATYRQLDETASAIGDRLARFGLRAGDVVAVAVPKSLQLVATCLAVLRAGAAYVCLDPTQPPGRLQLLTTDADATVIVTTGDTGTRLAQRLAVPILDLDTPLADAAAAHGSTSRAGAGAGPAVAYLTYTSGSTGPPKAVVTSHTNAVAALHARTTYFDAIYLGDDAPRTLVTLPAFFDVAGHMIFWTLSLGGTVVFPDDHTTVHDPDQVRDLIERHRVTHVNFTASWYRQFLTSLAGPWRAPLRVVAIGGEAPSSDLAALHAHQLPDTELHNEYGPTEATVWCSATCLHHPANPPAPGPVTIGRPLANYSLFVVDNHGRLAPIGATGELYIGGDGVAIGYLAYPDLTEDSFVVPRHGPLAGMRLYRTGDRCRLGSDGRFMVAGRIDDQLKIRGYRIEPAEIEQCLTSHPRVAAAAVTAVDEPVRLVAYVVPTAPGTDDAGRLVDELGRWVALHLPAYMAPGTYVVLDELPVTATGKIDRARLPAPPAPPQPRPGSAEPALGLEAWLLDLFRSVLGRRDVGLDDDFFDEGGDSLQAISLSAQARTAGLELPVPLVLRARTVRALAAAVDRRSSETPFTRRPAGTRLPLTPIQGWFFAEGFAKPHHFNQARLFEVDPAASTDVVQGALGWVLACHDAFRTRFEHTPNGWVAVLDPRPPHVPIPETPLPTCPDRGLHDRISDALAPLQAGLDIVAGPLVRAALLTDPPTGRRWLALVIHHLLIDTVSWGIVTIDLDHAADRLTAGDPPRPDRATGVPHQPPDPPTTAEIAYWQRLANTRPNVRPTVTAPAAVGQLRHTERTLSPHATRYLVEGTPRLYEATTWSMLLAALCEAFAPITGTDDLYAMVEGHGRDDVRGADQIVGWLTSLYPVLLRTDGAHDLATRATRFQRQLAEVPRGGTNFGRARYLEADSPLSRVLADLDLPAVTVNYLGHTPETPWGMVRPTHLPTGAAIGPRNVLPSALHITAATHGDSMVLRCSYDPALDATAIDAACTRLAVCLEHAARVVALTDQPLDPDAATQFFIHPVGGRVEPYAPLARRLAPRRRSWGLAQLAPAASIDDLAATHAAAIADLHLPGPVALAGWSFGAIVAYETARHLEAKGQPPSLVTLLDPPTPPQTTDQAAEALTVHLTSALADVPAVAVRSAVDDTIHAPADIRARELAERLGVTDDRSVLDQIAILLANHAAFGRWRPRGAVPHLQVVIPHPHAHRAAATTAAWQPHSQQPITVTTAGENHHSMLADDVEEIAETLAADPPPAG